MPPIVMTAAFLVVVLLSALVAAAPHQEPLCSVVMTYDEINSISPHWSAGFKVKIRQPLEPGSILEVQLAGNHTSMSSPIPTIVGIKIDGENICPTEKVYSTISTYSSSKSASADNDTDTVTMTTTEEAEMFQTDSTTTESSSTNPTTPQEQLDT